MGRARGHGVAAAGSQAPKRRGRGAELRWTPERIEAELRALVGDSDDFPSSGEFVALGRPELCAAVKRHGGISYWAERLGKTLRSAQDRRKYTREDAERDARLIVEEFGSLPGVGTLRRLGYGRLASFISWRFGNARNFAADTGLPPPLAGGAAREAYAKR